MRRMMLLVAGAAVVVGLVSVAVSAFLANRSSGVTAVVALPDATKSRQARWAVTDLGVLPRGNGGFALAINDRSQIVGATTYPSDDGTPARVGYRATLWEAGKITSVGNHPMALDINNSGRIVGTGFLWENGKTTGVGVIDLTAINDRGQIVGDDSAYANARPRVFRWQQGRTHDLAGFNTAKAINDRGQIVGVCQRSEHACLFEKGRTTDLGTLGGPFSEAVDINVRGQIVGTADTRATDEYGYAISHPFLWEKGKMTDLGDVIYDVEAINDRGQIVGACDFPNTSGKHACLWEKGKLTDLGTLPQMPESIALGINNRGQIVGQSTDRPVLWTLRSG